MSRAQSPELYEKFIKSFVVHYDFSPEGRYTHEYHPFLLEQTRLSFEKLELFLKSSGFDCKGRIVIMGYQQEGVPSYYSSLNAPTLDDEASLSSKRGRVVPAHNIFGFLTGFLLKDANWFQQEWFPGKPLIIEHVVPERVDLFDDYAYIFQRHAFGKDFETLLKDRRRVEKSLKAGNTSAVLQELILFWERAYKGELKSCGQEILATQDILFSVDYAKHLINSVIPVSKMYVGPDITYPIEVLSFQEQAATEAAQHFVQMFTETIHPYDNKKTAYIFCSFVDGVGKSTLLGNVINWVNHKHDIASYERVDNASSQKGVLYPLKDDVFIMDLPAQLSHWVGKPDGQVFVAMDCVHEISLEDRNSMKQYVQDHVEQCKELFGQQLQAYKQQKAKPAGALGMYLENLVLFNPEKQWVPFTYRDFLCLFDNTDISQIKVLVPLEGVHSKGLKTAQPEHMVFTKGLMIPLRFDVFMQDVVDQFKKAGIEKLVFVDFLSMYPRSSRENVRVIFLLQQLKKIYQDHFIIEMSLYRSFVNREAELYHLISFYKEQFFTSLFLESMARTLLYSIFTEKSADSLTLLSFDQVTELLRQETIPFFEKASGFLSAAVEKKLDTEHRVLHRYAFDRKYELFTRFSFEPLYAFSQFMEDLFGNRFTHPYFTQLWQGMDGVVGSASKEIQKSFSQGKSALKASLLVDTELQDGVQNLSSGVQIRCLDVVPTACRDGVTLSALFPLIRAHWYVALSNLLESEEVSPGRFSSKEPKYYVPPLSLKPVMGQRVIVAQKQLDTFEEKLPMEATISIAAFNNYVWSQDIAWAEVNHIPHCIEWARAETFFGVYAFGYDWDFSVVRKIVDSERDRKIKMGYEDPAVFAAELVRVFDEQQMWQHFAEDKSSGYGSSSSKKKKITVASCQGRAIALWVRAIATLEMLVKDPQSHILVRKGVREDFVAALRLLERVTLPRYFGIYLDKNLFGDYNAVEPVIPWELIV